MTHRILYSFIFLCLVHVLSAQDSIVVETPDSASVVEETFDYILPMDSSTVEWRYFDSLSLDAYLQSGDYDFGIQAQYQEGLLSRIWSAFKNWFRNLIGRENENTFWKFAQWIIIIAGIGILIKFLMDTTGVSIFRKEEKVSDLQMNLTKEELGQDLLALISKAENEGDYRLAIRYHFLQLLKYLDGNELIHFKEHKTNSDYYYEIKNKNLKTAYAKAANIYDYAWYGKLDVDQYTYTDAANEFKSIYNSKSSA
jgi:hypothetical protein